MSTISYKTKQTNYDMWLQYSITSVDCRNGRESVKIRKLIYIQRFGSDIRNEIALVEKKKRGKTYYTATRRIATCTIRKLKMKLADTGVVASEETIQNLKPFYVVYATEREKVLCMCKFCFNTRSLFDALMVHHKENKTVVYTSISKFLMNSCDCDKVENGYLAIKNCCTGKCSSCKIIAIPIEVSITDPEKEVSYYLFESVVNKFICNKTGQEKQSIKCERVNHQGNYKNIFDQIMSISKEYFVPSLPMCKR